MLEALNNNIILGGDDAGEGHPAESSHPITVKGSVHAICACVGCRQTPLYSLDGQSQYKIEQTDNLKSLDWQGYVALKATLVEFMQHLARPQSSVMESRTVACRSPSAESCGRE